QVATDSSCDRDVAVHGDRAVGGIISALLVPGRGASLRLLPQPRPNDRVTALKRVVRRAVSVLHIVGEQVADLTAVVALPGIDICAQPAIDLHLVHNSPSLGTSCRDRLPTALLDCMLSRRYDHGPMTAWRDIEQAEPEFARRVRALFDAHRHKTIATL